MASVASVCAGGTEHPEPSHCHHRLFLLSELNTHYLNMHLWCLRHSIHVRLVRISLHLNLLTTGRNVTLGDGIIWNASSHRAPLTASLSFSPANPASADALAHDILKDETTNLQEQQPRTAKWCCAMTFLVGKRVSCIIMCNNPLINQESHCTASFRGSWLLFLQICSMARTKQTPRKGDVERRRRRGSHRSGGLQLKLHFIDPLYPHQEMVQGIHRTKVWMYLIHWIVIRLLE